jgi:hypothetical protein
MTRIVVPSHRLAEIDSATEVPPGLAALIKRFKDEEDATP